MKIRIKGNTLRLRLSTKEWHSFQSHGKVEDCIEFGPHQKIIYTLRIADNTQSMEACFNNPFIMVLVPRVTAISWIEKDSVGIRGAMPLPDGNSLQILVEKDFQCLQPRQEDETALFSHPHSTTTQKA